MQSNLLHYISLRCYIINLLSHEYQARNPWRFLCWLTSYICCWLVIDFLKNVCFEICMRDGATYMWSDSPGRGKWSKCGIFYLSWSSAVAKRFDFFQLSSTVNRFCPLHAKNVSVLALAFFLFSKFYCFYPHSAIFGTIWGRNRTFL